MTLEPDTGAERMIKSADRVRDLAEVFTPAATVQAMLDLLPSKTWAVHPSLTFLEPACGDGNFIVAILDRKLDRIDAARKRGRLPAGTGEAAVAFHALEALASIYAIDISEDNVVGGTPGHEVGARERLLRLFESSVGSMLGSSPARTEALMTAAHWIVTANIQVGNMLPPEVEGSGDRDSLPLIEYRWDAEAGVVTVLATTLGAVLAAQAAETSGAMLLFGPAEPTLLWQGPPTSLFEATPSANKKARARAAEGGR